MNTQEQIVHDCAKWLRRSAPEEIRTIWGKLQPEKRKWFENYTDFCERVTERLAIMEDGR